MTKQTKLSMTNKQRTLVTALVRGNINHVTGVRESDLDLDQLIEILPTIDPDYEPSKASIQFSIRYLIKKGLVERAHFESRRGKSRRIIVATPLGVQLCFPRTTPGSDMDDMDGIVMEGFDLE